jgi:hypothetical protein
VLSDLFEIRKGNHSGLFATWMGHELSILGKSYVVALLLTEGTLAHSMKDLSGRSGLETKWPAPLKTDNFEVESVT